MTSPAAISLGWDQAQVRAWDAVCRHTALAQLRQATVRSHLCDDITLPATPAGASRDGQDDISGADLRILLGDAPVPARGGQPCPSRIAAIRLTIAEAARIERLARQHAGLITRARLAFDLRWPGWRRRQQARARRSERTAGPPPPLEGQRCVFSIFSPFASGRS
jgi:hypothetical protein